MSVCVAISVRNGGRYLAPAIESVLAQTDVDLELRIYDNGSTDGSVGVARSYLADPRVSHTVNERDLNYYGSLNRALRETGCRYFVPFAADDLMLAGNLARKVEALDRTGAGFAHSRAVLIDGSDAAVGLSGQRGLPEHVPAPQFFACVAPVNIVSCQATVVRTTALRWLGGFDEQAWYCADWLAWMLLSLRLGVVSIDDPLIANRVHDASATSATSRNGVFALHCRTALETALADEYFPGALAPLRSQLRGRQLVYLARMLAEHGNLRVTDGAGAYAYAAEAAGYPELRAEAADLHRGLVEAAGLQPSELPFDAVARTPESAEAAAQLAAECRRLVELELVGALALAAPATGLEAAAALYGPLFEDVGLDVDLVPAELEALLQPGRTLIAPVDSPDVAAAEALGIAVAPFGAAPAPPPWLVEAAA